MPRFVSVRERHTERGLARFERRETMITGVETKMNRTATFPLPSIDGKVFLKGYDKPLPQQVAAAIGELGNPKLKFAGESKLRSALASFGVKLSISELRSILVANNGLPQKEALSLASSFFAER